MNEGGPTHAHDLVPWIAGLAFAALTVLWAIAIRVLGIPWFS